MTVKTRTFKESNYHSIYFNGKTLRTKIDGSKPITELEYPEFYDVKITNRCKGECPWCYQNSTVTGLHAENIIHKIEMFFGTMDENQKPFQVAIGGGEPTLHPYFLQILERFYNLGIAPNYTTNGMWSEWYEADKIVEATKEFSEGVALSCHPHLKKYWENASNRLLMKNVMVNFHNIISDKKSINEFLEIFNNWKNDISYFVLLPHIAQGRADEIKLDWEYLFEELLKLDSMKQIALGANFYPYLKQYPKMAKKVDIYEPEIMSKYLDMTNMKIYPSSFSVSPNEEIKLAN